MFLDTGSSGKGNCLIEQCVWIGDVLMFHSGDQYIRIGEIGFSEKEPGFPGIRPIQECNDMRITIVAHSDTLTPVPSHHQFDIHL